MRILILLGCLSVIGCAAINRTSKPVSIGPQSYTLSVRRCSMCESASAAATEAASDTCQKENRFLVIRTLNVNGSQPMFPADASITFSCVTSDDPEYVRPTLVPVH